MKISQSLSKRERQIMDIIYRHGRATAAEVREAMEDAPSYSSVRALLTILVQKGYLRYTKDGPRYVYSPKKARAKAARDALRQLLHTFFDGSPEKVVATLLDLSSEDITPEELERLAKLVEQAKQEEK